MLDLNAGGESDLPFELPWTGRGEIIAITDTGLDTGDPATIHPDFRGRIVDLSSWPVSPAFDDLVLNPRADDGPADLDSGHVGAVTGVQVRPGRRNPLARAWPPASYSRAGSSGEAGVPGRGAPAGVEAGGYR